VLFERYHIYFFRSAVLYNSSLVSVHQELHRPNENKELVGPQLLAANLRSAEFGGWPMPNADIQFSDLSGAWFWGVDFEGSSFFYDDFDLAAMGLAGFKNVTLEGGSFRGAIMDWCVFDRTRFVGTNMYRADLSHSFFIDSWALGADFTGANFTGTIMKNAFFYESNFSRALGLSQSQLDGACGDKNSLPTGLLIKPCATGVSPPQHR
jgi:uncharacterized protein YjbI with pentapeptide repeats